MYLKETIQINLIEVIQVSTYKQLKSVNKVMPKSIYIDIVITF